jgi:cob(I)alamin adenosyltransferase
MVVLNRIYTRTGDDGTTALGSGERCIGMARVHTADNAELDAMLGRVQNDLFDLGADLARPDTGEKLDFEPLRIVASQVKRVEADIDALNKRLDRLRSFVLSGGSPASAALHLARTVARRAERLIVELARKPGESVSAEALQYINRVSDFLFVAARIANDDGKADVLWVPGKNR